MRVCCASGEGGGACKRRMFMGSSALRGARVGMGPALQCVACAGAVLMLGKNLLGGLYREGESIDCLDTHSYMLRVVQYCR